MTIQPEQALENKLIEQLEGLKYQRVNIKDEADLLANMKAQLEKHNGVSLSQKEFAKVVNHLSKGSVFDKAKTLRDKYALEKEDGTVAYIEFLNIDHWCQNLFQVTNQVTMEGKYKNRYDVTLLMNGIPVVQIELKRRGIELKEAFNQVKRYQKHSFGASAGLFQYIQFYVISNGVNTKYFSNQKRESFKNTFYWSDKENKVITNLEQFANEFLEPCHMSKMICKYVVINETMKGLMILRPYQFYAVEAIIERVKNSTKNGYIWHTTGSGKTLTSFKAAQILTKLPQIHKVVFVVDRKDLDFQTAKEYNSFQKDSVSSTDNTNILVKQFSDDTPLIVTTIQKLNTAISKKRYTSRMEHQKDKKIVFIFDECHRSQFGETHERIKDWFQEAQMFGFTGTPIFADNATKNELGKRTTKDLFEECLHKYVITDAIKDENVLKFSIEYVGRYREKEGSNNEIDIEVEDIDTKELLESPERLRKIVDYIAVNHDRKTHGKRFTAAFCVSSVKSLIFYYELLKAAKNEGKHNLKVATIFSYNPNEDDNASDGMIGEEVSVVEEAAAVYGLDKHSREKLDEFIDDYNQMFGSKYSTKDSKSFYDYYNDISKRVKAGQVDILLVVNMFLTGFDSKKLNTLYVDKNLKYHGLIQAFSRTNRTLDETKSQGNIVCFRNLKKATDDAIALFSNKDAKEVILMEPYENYVEKFREALEKMKQIAPTVDSVNDLRSEEEEFEFVKAFRELLRLKNVLSGFADFDENEIGIDPQEFEDYKSKYLDIHDKVRNDREKEKVSILNDVDFELELIHRDEVNVAYILKLLAKLKEEKPEDQEKRKKEIIDAISGDAQLRSKKELIEKFIQENLPEIEDVEQIDDAFESFWNAERSKALELLAKEESLNEGLLHSAIDNYLFTERKPINTEVMEMIEGEKPKLKERRTTINRIIDRMVDFVDTFIGGMGGVMDYIEQLGQSEWNSKRDKILLRDCNTCQHCNNNKVIQGAQVGICLSEDLVKYVLNEKIRYDLFVAFFQEAIVEIHTLYKSTPISNMNYLAYIKSGSTSIEYTRMDESTGISTSMKGKRVVGLRRINLGSLYESHWESYRRGFLNKMEVKPKELDELEKELLKCSIEVNNSYFWEYVYKLSVHHKYYQEGLMAWEYPDEALLTLCWDCHTELHETTQIDHYDQFGNLIGQLTPCARCFGAGYFPEYTHVENGVCFRCDGRRFD